MTNEPGRFVVIVDKPGLQFFAISKPDPNFYG